MVEHATNSGIQNANGPNSLFANNWKALSRWFLEVLYASTLLVNTRNIWKTKQMSAHHSYCGTFQHFIRWDGSVKGNIREHIDDGTRRNGDSNSQRQIPTINGSFGCESFHLHLSENVSTFQTFFFLVHFFDFLWNVILLSIRIRSIVQIDLIPRNILFTKTLPYHWNPADGKDFESVNLFEKLCLCDKPYRLTRFY